MQFARFDHIDLYDEKPTTIYKERIKLIQAAEKAGFYGYHVAEHHWTPLGMAPVPGIFLGAAAMATETIRIGSLVHLLPLYHPLRLIEEVCMLDQMSGGRLDLGVGRGISPYELGYFGITPNDSYDKFDEVLEALLAGLTNDELTFEGREYRFRQVPMEMKPFQKPYPPLWHGIGGPDSQEYAAKRGFHGVALGPTQAIKANTEAYRERWDKYTDERRAFGCQADEPMIGCMRNLLIADTDEEAHRITGPAYEVFYNNLSKLWTRWRAKPGRIIDNAEDGRKQGQLICGSPETVRQILTEQIAASGTALNFITFEMAWGSLSHQQEMRSLELFATEVMPHFTD
ncbi:MAG: LLM class flavin-dependent oxidoreductase [Proteobacteria bacterium]|nr:LLM class flavin-dependent oxidoreductase [Pseudomonadota bacterium]